MTASLVDVVGRRSACVLLLVLGAWTSPHAKAQDRPSVVASSKPEILAITSSWTGERSADGRPRVSDDLVARMKNVSIEEAWDVLRKHGYENQFVGGWTMLHDDQPFTGRALTAAYLPARPDLVDHVVAGGKAEGRVGPPNSWPIDMLAKGDVYIADGFGKVADGTLIGDNLGNSIYAKTGTGVVFDAGARDPDGLKKIEGFNAYVRGWDPSFLKNVVLSSINRPIRIGAATVLPGDVILARHEGVIAIPAHLVMSRSAEVTLAHETDLKVADVRALAAKTYAQGDIGASIASGSFRTRGMVVAPCSMRSQAEIATGVTSGLLTRAADVTLKERRRRPRAAIAPRRARCREGARRER